jgi:hypothetical protein
MALAALVVGAQGPTEQDKSAVRQAAYDYAEGYYEGAAERMRQGVHPAIVKREVNFIPGGGSILSPMNAETLVEVTRRGGGKLPAEKRNISFGLLDIRDNVASAKIFTARFHDYLHLVKQDGRWRIATVLWQPPTPNGVANAEADKAAVAQAIKDFFEGATAFDADRVERLVHPEAALRTVIVSPPPGGPFLMEGNRDGALLEIRAKTMPPMGNPSTSVLDVYDTIASALTTTPAGTFYWHLLKQDGRWRILNYLQSAAPPAARDFSRLAGPYLGQTPPGTTPQVFAPNAVSTSDHELNSVFTPDGREFYFTVERDDGRWTIMRSVLENGRWTPPAPASFSGKWSDVDLFITADGRQLYFCSNRPLQGDAPKDFDIWVSERSGAGWAEPRNMGAPINSPFAEFYPTLTRDGTMYFQSRRPGGQGAVDIWRSRLRDGRYAEAECLPAPVNTSGFEGDAFIAPDESYLIVSTRLGTSAPPAGSSGTTTTGGAPPLPPPLGLFLSVPRPDGTWSPLVSLGDGINSPVGGVNCEMLSPDGRYFFFTRGGDIYWVAASVIEEAKRRAMDAR